jgi:hypothetical protein
MEPAVEHHYVDTRPPITAWICLILAGFCTICALFFCGCTALQKGVASDFLLVNPPSGTLHWIVKVKSASEQATTQASQ